MYVHFVVVVLSFYQEFKCVSLAATCGPGGVFLPASCVDIALALEQLVQCGVGGKSIVI